MEIHFSLNGAPFLHNIYIEQEFLKLFKKVWNSVLYSLPVFFFYCNFIFLITVEQDCKLKTCSSKSKISNHVNLKIYKFFLWLSNFVKLFQKFMKYSKSFFTRYSWRHSVTSIYYNKYYYTYKYISRLFITIAAVTGILLY